jgi:hypothetical protein
VTDSTLHTSEAAPSTPVEISLEEAKALLAKAVEERGADYTYEQVGNECLYFDPATQGPSCLVGYVLSYKGITLPALNDSASNNSTDVHDLVSGGVIQTDLETEYLLSTAQDRQDSGATWGRALSEALEGYEEAAREAEDEAEAYDSSDAWDFGF